MVFFEIYQMFVLLDSLSNRFWHSMFRHFNHQVITEVLENHFLFLNGGKMRNENLIIIEIFIIEIKQFAESKKWLTNLFDIFFRVIDIVLWDSVQQHYITVFIFNKFFSLDTLWEQECDKQGDKIYLDVSFDLIGKSMRIDLLHIIGVQAIHSDIHRHLLNFNYYQL